MSVPALSPQGFDLVVLRALYQRQCGSLPSLKPPAAVSAENDVPGLYWDNDRDTLYRIYPRSNYDGVACESFDDTRWGDLNDSDEVHTALERLVSLPTDLVDLYRRKWYEFDVGKRNLGGDSRRGIDQLCNYCLRMVHTSILLDSRLRQRLPVKPLDDRTDQKLYEVLEHHDNIGDLRQSAQKDCHLCVRLDGLLGTEDMPVLYNPTPYFALVTQENHWAGFGSIKLVTDSWTSTQMDLLKYMQDRTLSPSLQCLYTGQEEVLRVARRWCKACLTTHQTCCMPFVSQTRFLPTRLVRLTSRGNGELSARLLLREEIVSGAPYITLSYCWGGVTSCRLKLDNIQQFRDCIPSSLPKTISEAFTIVMALGYQLLWVDSLCIIQDSEQDWEQEAATMGSVYQHSVCTIAAEGAQTSEDGCFHKRKPLSFLPCQLLRPTDDCEPVCTQGAYHNKPLYKRAWVVQERCLSPRTINFGTDQISWDCLHMSATEEYSSINHLKRNQDMKHPFRNMLNPEAHTSMQLNDHWTAILNYYLRCELTYTKDRWRAFQGLADIVSKAWGLQIKHGLWTHQLEKELMWKAEAGDKTPGRLDMAPTWSWLSIDRHVHSSDWFAYELVIDAFVLTNPTHLKSAADDMLEIEAATAHLKYMVLDDPEWNLYRIITECEEFAPATAYTHNLLYADFPLDQSPELWAVQIASTPGDPLNDLVTSFGIVVERSAAHADRWHRIGYFEMRVTLERVEAFRGTRTRISIV